MKMFYNLLSFFSMENFTEAFGEEIKMLTYNLTAYRSYNEEVKKENLFCNQINFQGVMSL